jgi:hypothetical protein
MIEGKNVKDGAQSGQRLWSMKMANLKNGKIPRRRRRRRNFKSEDTHLGSLVGSETQAQGGVCIKSAG